MKKLFVLFAVGTLSTFVACNQGGDAVEDETVEVVEEVTEATEETTEAAEESSEELAEHKCNDLCTEEACHYACGEKGHTCSDACHSHEEGDGHEHQEDGGEESEG